MKVLNYVKKYWMLSFTILIIILGCIFMVLGYQLISNILFFIISIWILIPLIYSLIKKLFKNQYGLDILAVIAILSSLLLNEFFASAIIVLMVASGQALEDYAKEHAKKELTELLKRAPKIAHKLIGDSFVDVPIDDVKVNDILQIKPGEVIPVDSIITKGNTSVDESSLTGESMPIDKNNGDKILSGSINQQSTIIVRAVHDSKNSQYEQIISMVSNAASSKSPFVRLADAYSVPFTIISLFIAIASWIISGQPIRALEVLVLATPCPLIIATPVALVSGMSKGARNGIIFKHGASLEKLAKAKAIALDKTGTLTEGAPKVDSIISKDKNYTKNEILSLAAAVESSSTHSLATATVKAAKELNLDIPQINNLVETVGSGITAQISGKKIVVGKAEFLTNNGIKLETASNEDTAIYIAYDNKYIGVIYFNDILRKDANKTLQYLKNLNIDNFIMLTGDKLSTASRIAKNANITEIKANLLPKEKLDNLNNFKNKYGTTAFVGDGINDAPSIAAADVGIALGAKGSTAASESADIVIMLESFSKVADAVTISRRTINIAKQSIFLGIGLSIILMIFASLTGIIKPAYGALIQEFVDIFAIFSALRARK